MQNRLKKLVNSPIFWTFLLFWYLSGVTELLLTTSGVSSLEGFKDATVASALWLIPVLLKPDQAKKITALIAVFIWLTALPGVGYFLIYRQELTQSLLYIIFESNTMESTEYLQNYFSASVLFGFVVFSLTHYFIWRNIQPFQINLKKAAWVSVALFCLIFLSPAIKAVGAQNFASAYKSLDRHLSVAPPWQLGFGYLNYQTELAEVEQNLLQLNKIQPLENFSEVHKPLPTTVVLVIGESTNRLHMGLYGYPRNTNPKLRSIASELHIFNNVFASRPNTIESLQQVLTFADQQHPDWYKTKPSLIAMMKQAGYKSIWITNQQTLTARNTMLTTFAKQTDQQIFLNTTRKQNAYSFDEKVLAPYADALQDKAEKKFIVVHLLGTHMKYNYRFPESAEFFKSTDDLPIALSDDKKATINAYDNAVRYNDNIVYTLIEKLKARQQHSLLVYFSDHGDDVFDSGMHDFQGRNEGRPTYPMYAVPFMVWHSKNWFNQHIFNDTTILNRQYDNADFIYTWSDLLGLRYQGYLAHESMVNPNFLEDQILVGDPYQKRLGQLQGTQSVESYPH